MFAVDSSLTLPFWSKPEKIHGRARARVTVHSVKGRVDLLTLNIWSSRKPGLIEADCCLTCTGSIYTQPEGDVSYIQTKPVPAEAFIARYCGSPLERSSPLFATAYRMTSFVRSIRPRNPSSNFFIQRASAEAAMKAAVFNIVFILIIIISS